MLKFKIDFRGNAYQAEVDRRALDVVKKIEAKRLRKMKASAPVRTGKYRRGLAGEITSSPGLIEVEMGGTVSYSDRVEFGGRHRRPRLVVTRGMEGMGEETEAAVAVECEGIRDLV